AAAWKAMAQKDADIVGPLGGPEKATPGNNNGYNAYMSMKALVLAMRAASFSGKADTDKLIAAFENLSVPQGPDFPGGPLIRNKPAHRGRVPSSRLQITGQREHFLAPSPPDQTPLIGDCRVS